MMNLLSSGVSWVLHIRTMRLSLVRLTGLILYLVLSNSTKKAYFVAFVVYMRDRLMVRTPGSSSGNERFESPSRYQKGVLQEHSKLFRISVSITSIFLIVVIVFFCSVSASAVMYFVKYPDDYPYTLSETADGYRFTVDTSESCYWERYLNDTLRFDYTGASVTSYSSLSVIDNISFMLYPFGKDTFVPLSGLNADYATNFNIVFDASMVVPEDFSIVVKNAYSILDSSGSVVTTEFRNLLTFDYLEGTDGFGFGVDLSDVSISSGDLPVSIVYLVEFEGIDAETDNTSISFTISQNSEVSFIVTDSFVDSLQHEELKDRIDGMIDKQQQTNDKLDDIESSISGPGGTNDKLDDVNDNLDDIDNSISGPGGTNDKLDDVKDNLDDIENSISGPGGTNEKLDGVTDSLDDIYEGGPSAGDLIDGGDKIADAGQDLGDDIDQIQDFENQYMGQFEENLDDIINSVDLNFLSSPLSMIQTCLNKTVASIPSQYRVVFTLPALIGLFMYIVGHPIKISHLGRGDPAHRSFSPGPVGKGGDSG